SSKGCELCFSGFMGRTAVYEYIDQSNISEILTKNTLENQSNFVNLFNAGIELVEMSETTLQEIYSIIGNGVN
ncbi:GspE family protein, partial [Providencia rettgeri]|nr:GspE family protein [Providencia rettgeri]